MGFGAAAPWDLKHVIWSSGTVGFGAWQYILIGGGGSVGFGSSGTAGDLGAVEQCGIWEQRKSVGFGSKGEVVLRHKEWVGLASVLWVDLKTETEDIKDNKNTLIFGQHIGSIILYLLEPRSFDEDMISVLCLIPCIRV